jgi:hypothetical protein
MDAFDMLIAQLSVAGEVHTRPAFPDRSAKSDDQAALDEFACDRSNLPWVIFRAAHRASHISALPARARSLLAALARTVDASRPHAAIFARRELLTGRALQSMRTFYRSLDDLETAGFIARPPQTRYGAAGLFGRAYLHLTTKAAVILGLVEEHQKTNTTAACSNEAPATRAIADPLLNERSATLAHRAIYKDLNPTNQKRQPGRLPADLIRLRQLGFREFLIFKLMREASSHGKRLSDVVEATWGHLEKARHPISYLRTLLRSPVDFAYRVWTMQGEIIAKAEKHRADNESAVAGKELRGRTFTSADRERRYVVSDDATSITLHQTGGERPRVRVGKWIPEFLRALRSGDLVPDAPGNEEAFAVRESSRRHILIGEKSTAASRAHIQALKSFLNMRSASKATLASNSSGTSGRLPACIDQHSSDERRPILEHSNLKILLSRNKR